MQDIDRLEKKLWQAADNLRANSKLTSGEYCIPVLGVIFLRMLPGKARYETLLSLPPDADLGQALNQAMLAVERDYPALSQQLPQGYEKFAPEVLVDLLRMFNGEGDGDEVSRAGGDVFGRIYEYFLREFALQGAQDSGEFFTPPSIVQLIVNILEPTSGIVFDPACGSGGMFVQSSHFIEQQDRNSSPVRALRFFGQEKNPTTIRLAKMNLAVHGLEGQIAAANTFYEDVHALCGRCDFVMANPPFNVDLVDADKVKADRRLPFGLPGVNKTKKIGNANYLWISYFHSYLNDTGRAGFVMSAQASSAGGEEAKVRRKLIETGDVDLMISIRSNFFYTRAIPCELWFLNRKKPHRDRVLMIDARNLFRKVTRKVYDFAPEQLANLTAIVWLYRGETERFLNLVQQYLRRIFAESTALSVNLDGLAQSMAFIDAHLSNLLQLANANAIATAQSQPLNDALRELRRVLAPYTALQQECVEAMARCHKTYANDPLCENQAQRAARRALEPLVEQQKSLLVQAETLHQLLHRAAKYSSAVATDTRLAKHVDRRGLTRRIKQLDKEYQTTRTQLKQLGELFAQVVWLHERFPDAELRAVPGLCKVVTRAEIEAADWSLSPGRYVGVSATEINEDLDVEQTLRDLHSELAELDREAAALSSKIQKNFAELVP